MNDDKLLAEANRIAAQRWNECDQNPASLFSGVIEDGKIYVYRVKDPSDSAKSLHEAYRQASRHRLKQRRRLVRTFLLLIGCGLIGLWSLIGWVPASIDMLCGIVGLVSLVLI